MKVTRGFRLLFKQGKYTYHQNQRLETSCHLHVKDFLVNNFISVALISMALYNVKREKMK